MRDAINLIHKTFVVDNEVYMIHDFCLVENTERIYVKTVKLSSKSYLEINFPLETILKYLKKNETTYSLD